MIRPTHRPAAGFAIVSALFLMVVLAALGGFLVNAVAVQHATPALKVESVRALFAARSGVAWAVARVRASGACPTAGAFSLTESSLSGFQLSISCSGSIHDLGSATAPYFVLGVTAQRGTYGGTDYVSRTLRAKVAGT